MRKFGYTSALHLVTLNDHVRRLIPHDSPYVCSNVQDNSYPHLIVQFGKDTRIKASDIDISTRQANRLIYHSDTDNILINLNEAFSNLIKASNEFQFPAFNSMQATPRLSTK